MSSPRPLLARLAARCREPLRAGLGAGAGVAATGLLARFLATGAWSSAPLLIAPIGASAVLAFALPASPLAQPRAVIGGNLLSCLVGVTAALLLPQPALAAGVAVGCAIVLMSLTRTLHPPGGAVALVTALAGGSAGLDAYGHALPPAILCSVLLTLAASAYGRLTGHRYPHRAPSQAARPDAGTPEFRPFTDADLDAALEAYGDELDVSREDLRALFRAAERQAERRRLESGAGKVLEAPWRRKAA